MRHAFERLTLQPDWVRALRATTAFTLARSPVWDLARGLAMACLPLRGC